MTEVQEAEPPAGVRGSAPRLPTEMHVRLLPWLTVLLLLAAPTLPPPAHAQPAARSEGTEPRPVLPADVVTHHTLALPGRTLVFTATAGSFRLNDFAGRPQADIATVSYTLDDRDPRTRPVAFAVNGGPGASSAWLQLGALGPWRLALEGPPTPSSPSAPVPNAETWLDFTDLVFIDPPGTGYSLLTPANDEFPPALLVGAGRHPGTRRGDAALAREAGPHRLAAAGGGGELWRLPGRRDLPGRCRPARGSA